MQAHLSIAIAGRLAASALAGAQEPPAPDPTRELTAPDIPGVVAGGTTVQFLRAGLNGTEGVVAMPDGSVLFTEQDADRVLRIGLDGAITTFASDTNRTIGLAFDPEGRLVGTQSRDPRVGVLHPTREVLADSFGGQPLVRPNDLIIDRRGGIYFTDPIPGQNRFREPPPGRTSLVLYRTPEGELRLISDALTPNGVMLSPDEKTLYATNGAQIVAFDVQPDGGVRNMRTFADSRGDGLAVDNAGRLYAAVAAGINVISPQGEILGTIPTPVGMQSVGFAGPDKRTLFMVGRGAAYKVEMLAEGIRGRAK